MVKNQENHLQSGPDPLKSDVSADTSRGKLRTESGNLTPVNKREITGTTQL